MVGGLAGLAGAAVVGPRHGRFDYQGKPLPIPGLSATLCTIGKFILWFGWYGFNPGSALAIQGENSAITARCTVTTTLAAGAGGLTTLVIIKLRDHVFDVLTTLNGLLAGLVSITAYCAFVDDWAAVVIGAIGAIGAFVYVATAMLLLELRIDDPLEAFPIHGAGGFWGVIAYGLFSHEALPGDDLGLFYGGGGKLLLANIIGALIIAAWTLALITPLFIVMRVLGLLRISTEEEIIGNDVSKHGGVAYPIDSAVVGAPYPSDSASAAEKAKAQVIDNLGMDDSLKEPVVSSDPDHHHCV